jgi:hypothetical protein
MRTADPGSKFPEVKLVPFALAALKGEASGPELRDMLRELRGCKRWCL